MSFSSFVSHIRTSISTWWSNHNPGATIKAAVDTLNSLGIDEHQLEALGGEVIAIAKADITGLEKAVRVAEQVSTWTGPLAMPPAASQSLHAVISLVHLIAKLSGKL